MLFLILTSGCAFRSGALTGDQPAALVNDAPAARIDAFPSRPIADPAIIECPDHSSDLATQVERLPPTGDPPDPSAIDGNSDDLCEVPREHPFRSVFSDVFSDVWSDHAHYYSGENLGKLAIGVGTAALLANTSADESLRSFYLDHIGRSKVVHATKYLGTGQYAIPVIAVSALADSLFDGGPMGHDVSAWGNRSLRALAVGTPPMLAMQWAIGSSRPEEGFGSRWKPFKDTNGVSGHAFLGAVPFISAAKMTDDPFWKAGLYFASALPGLSRINDDDHFASQVVLGWWMAYLAASAVDETQLAKKNLSIGPTFFPDGVGVGIEYRR